MYIGTSNKTEKGRSPFNFKEKVKIMTTMFGIPKSKIVQVKNPYNPQEVLKRFNKETTAFVTVVGQKDASRLSHKYFQKYDGNPTEGYEDRGYLYVAPIQGGSISGTEVRQDYQWVLMTRKKSSSKIELMVSSTKLYSKW